MLADIDFFSKVCILLRVENACITIIRIEKHLNNG